MRIITSYKIHSMVKAINEALDPDLEARLKRDLKKYCEEMGKDFKAVCDLAGISPGGISEFPHATIEALDSITDKKWKFNEKSGVIDVNGSVRMYGRSDDTLNNLAHIVKRVKFGKVSGSFMVYGLGEHMGSEKLEKILPDSVGEDYNASFSDLDKVVVPAEVGGYINLANNKITSLKGLPKETNGGLDLERNRLKNLIDGPEKVNGDLDCTGQRNLLGNGPMEDFSLEGAPREVTGSFKCSSNNLKTLEGSPEIVGGGLDLEHNELDDLVGGPKSIGKGPSGRGKIKLRYNNLATLDGLPLDIPTSTIECSKNLLPPAMIKETYEDAKAYKSWLSAHLKLMANPKFKRKGARERAPIVAKTQPEVIAKSPARIAPIWNKAEIMNDPVVRRLVNKSGIKGDEDFKKDVTFTSDLGDMGLM